jgi:hypothetical protein
MEVYSFKWATNIRYGNETNKQTYKHLRVVYIIRYTYYASYMFRPKLWPSSGRCIKKEILIFRYIIPVVFIYIKGVTKNTATQTNHSLYKLPMQEARFIWDSHKPQSRINTPTDDHTTSLPRTSDSNVHFGSKQHHVTYKWTVTTRSRWTLYTYCI